MSHRILVTGVALGLAVASLGAHIVVPAEFREVVDDSGLIARGTVTDVRAVPVPDGGIDSIATVAVQSVVKGDAAAFVYVRVPGGQIGATRFVMTGAPTLRQGDQAVFLLRRGRDNFWRPVGLTMGVFRVRREASGRQVVTPPAVAARGVAGAVVRGQTTRAPMAVAEFEGLIRTVALDRARAVRRGGDR